MKEDRKKNYLSYSLSFRFCSSILAFLFLAACTNFVGPCLAIDELRFEGSKVDTSIAYLSIWKDERCLC
jgi:hypothetical protein